MIRWENVALASFGSAWLHGLAGALAARAGESDLTVFCWCGGGLSVLLFVGAWVTYADKRTTEERERRRIVQAAEHEESLAKNEVQWLRGSLRAMTERAELAEKSLAAHKCPPTDAREAFESVAAWANDELFKLGPAGKPRRKQPT